MRPSELLADPKSWTKGAFARNAQGRETSVYDDAATCWCLVGSIIKCPGADQRDFWRALSLQVRLKGFQSIPQFNDHPNTIHEDVLALLKEAEAEVYQ